MKLHTIPVKRKPVSKGIIRRLSAVIPGRKQRVAAAAPALEAEAEENAARISRVLIILFLIHIVAIGLIFVHQRFLNGRAAATAETAKTGTAEVVPVKPAAVAHPEAARSDLPRLVPGDKPYVVKTGDNYAKIAATEGVDESNLRALNKQVNITPGLTLKIPPKRIVAMDPPEVTTLREKTPSDQARGFLPVETTPVTTEVSSPPKAHLVHPATTRESPPATKTKTGKTYIVQPGDTIWRIANRCKVSEQALMRANGISDARKLKNGMKLVIPKA